MIINRNSWHFRIFKTYGFGEINKFYIKDEYCDGVTDCYYFSRFFIGCLVILIAPIILSIGIMIILEAPLVLLFNKDVIGFLINDIFLFKLSLTFYMFLFTVGIAESFTNRKIYHFSIKKISFVKFLINFIKNYKEKYCKIITIK